MKKYFALVVMLFFMVMFVGMAHADTALSTTASVSLGINELEVGTYYDINGKQLLVGVVAPVIGYKSMIDLGIGCITNITDHAIPLASIELNIQEITNSLGLQYKLLEPLRIGVFYAKDLQRSNSIDNATEFYGVSWNVVWKF